MKATTLLLSALFTGLASADFEPWTNQDGKTVDLELVSKSEKDGDTVGTFRMRNGHTVDVAASTLSADSASRLMEWEPSGETADAGTAPAGGPSVFDDIFDGNLVKLDGKRLKKVKDFQPPKKHYIFYRTASWCGPCHKFTPSLVKYYNEHKSDDFELVLITSDSSEDAMEGYAEEMEMPWPQLKLRKVEKFDKEHPDKCKGIPYLVVTDLQGKILAEGNAYGILPQLDTLLKD
ncbi:thioredoxin-like domain-containing protein [Haloferula sargassicola]|uniref:Thioredoxin domain-containing protein n=1 Tax=Haloferula sargassicola TaxID=490096 RepID=A0ABP9URM9_9BACT